MVAAKQTDMVDGQAVEQGGGRETDCLGRKPAMQAVRQGDGREADCVGRWAKPDRPLSGVMAVKLTAVVDSLTGRSTWGHEADCDGRWAMGRPLGRVVFAKPLVMVDSLTGH